MRRAHIGAEVVAQPSTKIIEDENEKMEEMLSGKVDTLKSLSIDIGTEVRSQNKYLQDMDDDFDTSSNLLQTTMARLKGITKAKHWKIWLYLFLFTCFVFGVCWFVVRFR